MLLDVQHMVVGLQSKALATIANEAKLVSSAPWIPLMIDQLLMYTKERGIYLPEHALFCNFLKCYIYRFEKITLRLTPMC